jgi:hypothetical protein
MSPSYLRQLDESPSHLSRAPCLGLDGTGHRTVSDRRSVKGERVVALDATRTSLLDIMYIIGARSTPAYAPAASVYSGV